MISETQLPRMPRAGDRAIRRRRFPAVVAGCWAVAWAASLALYVATRTVGHAPFVALLHGASARVDALPAHPTTLAAMGQVAGVGLMIGLMVLAVIVVLAAPLCLPALAAGHIIVAWLRGGAR
jgi:hypothetical protein